MERNKIDFVVTEETRKNSTHARRGRERLVESFALRLSFAFALRLSFAYTAKNG